MPRKKSDTATTPPEVVEQALVLQDEPLGIVRPQVSPQQAAANFKAYKELCNALLEPSDFTKMVSFQQGKGSVIRLFKNKSAWRKLATAFNLSYEVMKEERSDYETYFVVRVTARVTAPNGRFVDGTGTCASNERKFAHVEHDVRAQAETRAKSRAISDMIGAGETSAEEMMQIEEAKKEKCPRDHEALPQKTVVTEGKNKGRPYVKCPSCTYFAWLDAAELDAPISYTDSGVPKG